MKQIVVLSGKGGTGKTTVAASLAHLAHREGSVVMVDADVDASNLELVLSPTILEEAEFSSAKVATVHPATCTGCGICHDICRFDAILADEDLYKVDPIACEGCAACHHQCPVEAIRMEDTVSGRWFRSETRFGSLFHARLHPGEENSGKLVSLIRQRALQLGRDTDAKWVVVDGSPGIGCPVIAAATGADVALLVAEPTVSGIHDLRRILQTVQHFRIPAAVCINKADVNPTRAADIRDFCRQSAIPIAAEIPYDDAVTRAMIQGTTVTEFANGPVAAQLNAVWQAVRDTLSQAEDQHPSEK
jgi:MinD superfamily P-loop ATPase